MSEIKNTRPNLGEKILYGSGDLASNLIWKMTLYMLMPFYTEVVGLSPLEAAMVFVIARIWDGVNDPLMGLITDRTSSKWGKFRPYLLFGPIPLLVCAVLTFSNPGLEGYWKFIYALGTYILLGMAYTAVNIPYSALTASISLDTSDRTLMSTFRIVFGFGASFIINSCTDPILSMFESKSTGYSMVMLLYASVALLVFWGCFKGVKERYSLKNSSKVSLKDMWYQLRVNKPLLILCGATVFMMSAYTVKAAAIRYYVTWNLGDEQLFAMFNNVIAGASLLSLIICNFIIRIIGKKSTAIIGGIITIMGSAGMYFSSVDNLWTINAFSAIAAFGAAMPMVCAWAMIPDTVEYGHWKTGRRTEGINYSAFSLVMKLAFALGGLITGLILHEFDYSALASTQSDTALTGINLQITLLPAFASAIAIGFLMFYPLTEKMHSEILIMLEKKHSTYQVL